MKIRLYHGNDENKTLILESEDRAEITMTRYNFIRDTFGKSYYTRCWIEGQYVKYDYGSYSDFCYEEAVGLNPEVLVLEDIMDAEP